VYSNYVQLNAGFIAANSTDAQLISTLEEPTRTAVLESISHLDPGWATVQPAPPQQVGDYKGWWRFAWTGAFAAVLAVAAFWLGIRYERTVMSGSAVASDLTGSSIPGPPIVVAGSNLTETQLRDALDAERQRSRSLEAALGTDRQHLFGMEHANDALQQRIAEQGRLLSDTQSLLDARAADLKRLEATREADTATLVALRYEVSELADKLKAQSESFRRQTELLAGGREIRDIIGARNLHIVDVYDADSRGRTKKPFARAFYTEGKSLVFYAYDLPVKEKSNGEYAYVAWGQRGGKSSSIRNLGILINDDKGQKRWMLTFSDPAVLAEIDSVFITLEPAADALKPSGKRMLTAYLEDIPNHP
jgi:hypothetical protein